MSISDRDLRIMLDITAAEDVHADPGQPVPWSVLDGLRSLIPADTVTLVMFDARQRRDLLGQEISAGDTTAEGDASSLYEAFWTHYWHCPPCHYPDSTGDLTTVTTISDFYTDRELHATGMYCDYLKYIDGERELMLCLPSQPGRVLRLLFWRGHGPDFTQRDRDLLTLLRPHLHRVYRRRTGTPSLTGRQQELLRLVAVGHTNGQIGRRMGITEATVRKHLEHIYQRLDVASRTAAVTRLFGSE